MKLTDYIKKNYDGNQSEFGRSMGVDRATVSRWIRSNFIVDGKILYSPRRDLTPPTGNK